MLLFFFFSLSLHEIDRKKAVQKVHDTLGFILTQHHISLQIFTQINHIAFWCWYSFFTNLHLVCFKYVQLKNVAGTSPSKGAIWDEFSEQHQHKSTKNAPYSCFGANK
jgi:hypothetical protein